MSAGAPTVPTYRLTRGDTLRRIRLAMRRTQAEWGALVWGGAGSRARVAHYEHARRAVPPVDALTVARLLHAVLVLTIGLPPARALAAANLALRRAGLTPSLVLP